MDKILIHELKIETIIGCLNWERSLKQLVIFDIEIDYDCKLAGQTDLLSDTLDYLAIANTVTEFVSGCEFRLLEALAQKTADLILEKYRLKRVYIKLSKPGAIANAKAVTVAIERIQVMLEH